jgi:hypothetical protein
MTKGLLTEKYATDILGILGCYDRIIIRGTPGSMGYAEGMTSFFYSHRFKIFDFAKVFNPAATRIAV